MALVLCTFYGIEYEIHFQLLNLMINLIDLYFFFQIEMVSVMGEILLIFNMTDGFIGPHFSLMKCQTQN